LRYLNTFLLKKSTKHNQVITAGATIVDSASTLKDNFNFEEFKKGIFSEINKQKEATRKTLSKIQNN